MNTLSMLLQGVWHNLPLLLGKPSLSTAVSCLLVIGVIVVGSAT